MNVTLPELDQPVRLRFALEGGSAAEGDGPIAGFVLELGTVWG